MVAFWMTLAAFFLHLNVAQAQDFQPFDAGSRHPFAGAVSQIPGEGATPLTAKALNAPTRVAVKHAWRPAQRLSSNPLYLAALYYKNFLTKVDGPRCAHAPTCSRFANQAVSRHGLVGIWMGLERLIRTGRSSRDRWLPEIGSGARRRFFDPVGNYVIWEPERFTGFQKRRAESPLFLPPLMLERPTP